MASFPAIFSPFTIPSRDRMALVSSQGRERLLEAQTIVLALGSRANNEIVRILEERVPRLFVMGDCLEPRRAKEAIPEGFLAVLQT